MRSFVFALVLAVTAGLMGIGNAAELAACRGVVGPVLPPGDPLDSFQKDCIDEPFTITTPTTVNLSVAGNDMIIGTVSAIVYTVGTQRVGFETEATYIAGQVVDGQESTQVELPAGTYKFQVHGGGLGSFTGRVDTVAAPPPSESPSSESPSPPA